MKLLSLKHFFVLLLIFVNSVSVLAQCPDVITYNQTFCDLESATIANLDAVDNGGGVVWYASINGTTPLPVSTNLVNGNKYYADDSSGTCGSRQEVLVTIYTMPSAPSFQGICVNETSEATIALLLASGNNIRWYLTPSGGLPLASTTQLINNTLYYVSQTNPHTGCETSRRSVYVNIIILTTPVGDHDQYFCHNPQQSSPTLADIEINSPLYNWYINENSVIHLPSSTPLVDGHTYYATSVSGPCESQGRLAVTVHLFGPNDAGTSNALSICEADVPLTPTLNLFDQLGGTPQITGSWSGDVITANGHLGTIDLTLLTPNTAYTFTYTVDFYSICPVKESTVTITIIPILDAGTNGNLEICENDIQTYDLFGSLGGTPDLGGFWSPALSGGGSVFNPNSDAFGTYLYSFSDGCNTSLATVTVTEIPVFDAGTNGILELCEGDVQTYNLFDSLGGSPDLGGTWSPTLSSGNGIFNPALDAFGTFTYSFNDSCSGLATVTVTEIPILSAGLDGILDICEGDIQTYDLFNALGGTPDLGGTWSPALFGGGSVFNPALDAFGIYTYSFSDICNISSATVTITELPVFDVGTNGVLELCEGDVQTYDLFDSLGGSPDLGGTWTPALSGGGSVFNPALDTFGTYTYSFNDTCNNSSATVTVTEIPILSAGLDGSLELCEGDIQTYDLFDSLGGTPDLGGFWSPALSGGGSVFNPTLDAFGIYTYSFNDICNTSSASVTITELPVFDVGLDGVLELCEGDIQTYDLFDSLGGTPDVGGVWTPALSSGNGIFNPALDSFGTYTYSFIDACSGLATVTVTEIPNLNAGINGILEFCEGDVQTYNLFDSLGGTPDVGGVWAPVLSSGGSVFNPALDNIGVYTYSFIDGCNTDIATVTITELPFLDAGTNGTLELCEGDVLTYDLFDSLGGTPVLGGTWSPALSGGGSIFNPALDAFGVYTYSFNDICSTTATVTVTEIPSLDAGLDGALELCSNDTQNYDLFDSLNGTPDLGGVWTPALSGGGSVFNPALDAFGVYTYSFNDGCNTGSATLTVTEIPSLDAGTNATLDICEGDVQTYDLFDSLGGTPDLGGTWTPALSGGSSVFNPTLDAFGVYTYSFNDGCNTGSATVTVSEIPSFDAGTNGTLDICEGDTQTYDLFDSLGGTPDVGGTWSPALSGDGSVFNPALDNIGVYTYSFIDGCNTDIATVTITELPFFDAGTNGILELCEGDVQTYDLFDSLGGTPVLGGTWSPALTSGGSIFNPVLDVFGIYTYSFNDICSTSATVTITELPVLDAGTNGSLDLCEGDTQTYDLFDSLGGTPDVGGTWSPALSGGGSIFNPALDNFGIYTYSFNDICSTSATVTVSEIPSLDAGLDGTLALCSNDVLTYDLFDYLNGTPDLGGVWTPALSGGGSIFNLTLDTFGVYTYSFNDGCNTGSATVTVSEIPSLDAGTNGVLDICESDTQTYDLFDSLGGTPDVGGTWSPTLSGGGSIFNPVLDSFGVYTYSFNDICSTSATITVTEIPSLDAGLDGTLELCSNDTQTYDLFDSLNGMPDLGGTWTPALSGGGSVFNPALDVFGTYIYSFNDVCSTSATVNVASIDCIEDENLFIPDGFSPNDDGINDFFEIKDIRTLFPNFKIEIYNRYGNILFKGNRNTADWDGTSQQGLRIDGGKAPIGVYFYILEFNDGQKSPVQGRLYLSR